MQQTLPTYRNPRVAPYNPLYENPRYVAPIPPRDPRTPSHYAEYSQRPVRAPMASRVHERQPQQRAPRHVHDLEFRPRRKGRRGMWIGLGVGITLTAVVVLVLALASTGHSGHLAEARTTPGLIPAGTLTPEAPRPPVEQNTDGSADVAQLDRLVADFRDAADEGPTSNWMTYYCRGDRTAIARANVTTVIVPSAHFDRSSPLTDVEVTGTRARGELNGSVIRFRKESGDWKFCMTA